MSMVICTLNDILRDRLVCGIADSCIQRVLLAERELTFDKSLETTLAMESAKGNTQDLTSMSVYSVSSNKSSAPQQSGYNCHRCGEKHNASQGDKVPQVWKIGHWHVSAEVNLDTIITLLETHYSNKVAVENTFYLLLHTQQLSLCLPPSS